ncbi:MAG: hypothetical protein COA78_29340 [Blastopirellula sp.]|nr:MAG: hypothetical protein COA78_29340 [Blastopirellula sp.]
MKEIKINWYKPRSCWKKTYKGRTLYLASGLCESKEDELGKAHARVELADRMKQIDDELALEREAEKARQEKEAKAKADYKEMVDRERRIGAQSEAAAQAQSSDDLKDLPVCFLTDISDMVKLTRGTPNEQPKERTLVEEIDLYVDKVKQRATKKKENGGCSVSWFQETRDKLAEFVHYATFQGSLMLADCDRTLFEGYQELQSRQCDVGKTSPFTAKKRLKHARTFMEHCLRTERIDKIPAILDRKYAQIITLPEPNPTVLTSEQLKAFWNLATVPKKFSRKKGNRNALYMLLGLNCAYRAIDVSSLKHEHIKKSGDGFHYIDRKRNKTNAPQVHRLWPLTYQLLCQEMTDPNSGNPYCLESENGGPLVSYDLEVKSSHRDNIAGPWNTMRRKLKLTGKGLGHSSLRDTAATILAKLMPENNNVVSQFLSHKETKTLKYYVVPDYTQLFKGIDLLEKHFNLNM